MKFKRSNHIVWYLIYPLIPLMDIFAGHPFDTFLLIKFLMWMIVPVILYISNNRTIAEIKDAEIYFHEGVGITAPSFLKISQIDEIERIAKKMLKIRYDGDRGFSMEADKRVLNRIEDKLNEMITSLSKNKMDNIEST